VMRLTVSGEVESVVVSDVETVQSKMTPRMFDEEVGAVMALEVGEDWGRRFWKVEHEGQ